MTPQPEPEWDPDDPEPFGADTAAKRAEREERLAAAAERFERLTGESRA